MVNFRNLHTTFNKILSFEKIQALHPTLSLYLRSQSASFCSTSSRPSNVGVFWDLDNKLPKSFPPYEAAIKLRNAAQQFGFAKYMVAYANSHTFSYVPPLIRAERREREALNELETIGVVKSDEPCACQVCGRRFFTNQKLINHFQIHKREQRKRMNQIESSRGKLRLRLVEKHAVKMDKYKKAASDVLTPRVGYGLGDDIKRAGFWVREVSDEPQAAAAALRRHMVDLMDKRAVECVVLVSDNSDFVEILKESRLRCLKTVVVGDDADSALRTCAHASFSWKEIMVGKAKAQAVSVVRKWKEQNVLQRLEREYDPKMEKDSHYSEIESEESDIESHSSDDDDTHLAKNNDGAWWEINSGPIDVNRTQLPLK